MDRKAPDIREQIEALWRRRMKTQGLRPGSPNFLDAQANFFAGAIAVLTTLYPDSDNASRTMPPVWVLDMLSGNAIGKD